jgi:hypothetical protein
MSQVLLPDLGDRYQVIRFLGDGGMSVVFLARHTQVGRPVAVTVLRPDAAAQPDARERLLAEARAAATIAHANVVECLDVGETRTGLPFLVFELLDGVELHHELNEVGPFPVRRVLKIARQIAAALATAHERQVIHRDLKPENVFLTFRDDQPDHVKLLDFGIARFASEARPADESKTMLGTPHYMAPEQYTDAEAIDGRADVYALGVLCYRMLTGRTPYPDAPVEDLAHSVWNTLAPPVSAIRPEVAPAVVDLIARMLQPRVRHRPFMDEVLRELTAMTKAGTGTVVRGTPGTLTGDVDRHLVTPLATIAPPMGASPGWGVRPRAIAAAMAITGVAAAVGLAVFLDRQPQVALARPVSPERPRLVVRVAAPASAPVLMPVPVALYAPAPNLGVTVASDAPGAQVLVRGQRYELPLATELEAGRQLELVEVTAPGRQGRRFWLRLDQATELMVRLPRGRGSQDASAQETQVALGLAPPPRVAPPAGEPEWTVTPPPAPEPPPLVQQAASLPPADEPEWVATP